MSLSSLWKKRPRPDLKRLVPPGYPLGRAAAQFGSVGGWAALVSAGIFLSRFRGAYKGLFLQYGPGQGTLRADAVMPDFAALLPGVFGLPLLVMALLLAGMVLDCCRSFYRGSRSIYLMRRLPDRWELPRRCLALPLAGAVLCLAAAAVLLLFYFAFYMLNTPPECLTPHQWAKIWSVIP